MRTSCRLPTRDREVISSIPPVSAFWRDGYGLIQWPSDPPRRGSLDVMRGAAGKPLPIRALAAGVLAAKGIRLPDRRTMRLTRLRLQQAFSVWGKGAFGRRLPNCRRMTGRRRVEAPVSAAPGPGIIRLSERRQPGPLRCDAELRAGWMSTQRRVCGSRRKRSPGRDRGAV